MFHSGYHLLHHRLQLPKLLSYNLFKSEYGTENYVKKLYYYGKRKVISQFRCGVLPHKIETGRYLNIPIHFRMCELCQLNGIEDEMHFLKCCTLYQTEKNVLFSKAVEHYSDFLSYGNDAHKFILMNDEDLTEPTRDYFCNCFM